MPGMESVLIIITVSFTLSYTYKSDLARGAPTFVLPGMSAVKPLSVT